MKIQPVHHCFLIATSFVCLTTVPTLAEEFSFSLNGLNVTDHVQGGKTFSGSLSINSEQMPEPQTIDFDLTQGGNREDQFLDLGVRNQGDSILEVVFDIFGLNSRRGNRTLEANVSGEINPTESDLNVSLGENMPGMRVNIKTPQE